mgnify:CR=1 FL=1
MYQFLLVFLLITQFGFSESLVFVYPKESPPLYKGLENFHMKISTESEMCQKYFDQGLLLFYGYNFPESDRSFKEAVKYDPNCAICYLGEAIALGECIDTPGDHWCVSADEAYQKAKSLIEHASPKERALIESYAHRLPKENGVYDVDKDAYADSLRDVYYQFYGDPDIATIYGKAHMDSFTMLRFMEGNRPIGLSKQVLDALESARKNYPDHPGLNHILIHALEACHLGKLGMEAAKHLDGSVPGSGHLQHMPAHIYADNGFYHLATGANYRGVEADASLFAQGGMKHPEYAGFYLHNHYYLLKSLAMEGRSQEALKVARKTIEQLSSGQLPTNSNLNDVFNSVPFLLEARFGLWAEIEKEAAPDKNLPFSVGAYHYARGLMSLHANQVDKAEKELKAMDDSVKTFQKIKEEKLVFDHRLMDLLDLLKLDLQAELAQKNQDGEKAVSLLKEGVKIEEGVYMSMTPWYFSMRDALGSALNEQKRFSEAEAVFRQDLDAQPLNGWALRGLINALQGQGKDSKKEEEQFKEAWKYADFEIIDSRM